MDEYEFMCHRPSDICRPSNLPTMKVCTKRKHSHIPAGIDICEPPAASITGLGGSSGAIGGCDNTMPLLASQTRMIPSSDSEIMLDPLGENATERIQVSWPRRGGSISTPVVASQSRTICQKTPRRFSIHLARMRRK